MRQLNIPDGNTNNTSIPLSAAIKFKEVADGSANFPNQNSVLGNALLTGLLQGNNIVLIERMEKIKATEGPGWRIWYLV